MINEAALQDKENETMRTIPAITDSLIKMKGTDSKHSGPLSRAFQRSGYRKWADGRPDIATVLVDVLQEKMVSCVV